MKKEEITKELPLLTNEQYQKLLSDMLLRIEDNETLRFYCILVHDYSQIEYVE